MNEFERVVFWCKQGEGELDTFPVELSKDESRAEQWATTKEFHRETRRYGDEIKGNRFEYPNKFDNVTIQSLSYRGNGGRAYKVVINIDGKQFLVDFREDGIMDVILNTGIQAGGKLNGEFTFIKQGSQTKLVRIGSELHAEFFKHRKQMNSPVIPMKNLELMHLYEHKNGDRYLYVSDVYVPKTKYEKTYWGSRKLEPLVQVEAKPKKCKLFIRVDRGTKGMQEELNELLESDNTYPYKFLGTNSLTKDLGELTSEVCIIDNLKSKATKSFKAYYCNDKYNLFPDDMDNYLEKLSFSKNKDEVLSNVKELEELFKQAHGTIEYI